ncbi:MAG: glycosyltransferase family 4 protein [Rikenellaceae bacterium]|jgi:glycosyltransferase involved in cell wall biosynthesis|nr:glycosyltransferase family 4 protein [Rikenellaceae bacterium]
MRILLIHNDYARFGGEEVVVALQRRLLEEAGCEVAVMRRSSAELQGWRGQLRGLFSAFYSRSAVREVRRTVRDFRPDAAIVHNLFPLISPAVLPVLRRAGVRVAMTVHNFRLVCPNGLLFNRGRICERCASGWREFNCLLHNCCGSPYKSLGYALHSLWARASGCYVRNVEVFMALSEFQRDKLAEAGLPRGKIVVVPNCLDVNSMPLPSANVARDYVGFVGRLSREKGVDVLFEAVRRLPHIRFRVAGAGDAPDGKPENVELCGFLDRGQLADFYSGASMIAVTSICYETFCLTLIEAMYYGAPTVVPQIGAMPEVVGRGGVFYRAGDAAELAARIETLWRDGALRAQVAKEGRRRILEHYTGQQYVERILHAVDVNK